MTACLVYPTYSSYSFSAPLRPLQGGGGRGHHPHHPHHQVQHHLLQAPAQEAVDLRQQAPANSTTSANMLEDASMNSLNTRVVYATSVPTSVPASLPAAMYPLSPAAAANAIAEHRGKNQHLEEHYPQQTQHHPGRSPYGPADPPTASPPHAPLSPHASSASLQHQRGLLENGSCTSPGPDGGSRGALEDAKQRQCMSSPNSTGLSDNEDEYVEIACDKSDSSGNDSSSGSPHGKRSSSAGGGGGNGSGEKKVYRCQHCKYITDRKNNLKRHVVTMHEMCTKTLECCDVVFKNKASLRDHVVSCHKNGYDCRICGRTFCRKALLKRHITVHSGQKDYICGVCGYATSHKSNLDRHKRRHGPKFTSSDEGEMSISCKSPQSPTPVSSLHQLPPFTLSHKPNPLDVSNLVNNTSSHGDNGCSRYGGYTTITSIHRPEPVKPAGVYPLHDPALGSPKPVDFSRQPALSLPLHSHHHQEPHEHLHHHHNNFHGSPRKFRSGKYMLAKRLLYTYRRDATSQSNSENINHNSSSNNNNNNDDSETDCNKAFSPRHQEGEHFTRDNLDNNNYIDRQVMLGLEKRMTAKRLLLTNRKLRLSTKRLFPALYVCRRCSVVYENQLQLTEHVDQQHRDDDCPQLPQRPLTLQARPRAW